MPTAMRARTHMHNARGGGLFQLVEKQVGQQKMRQMIDRQGHFQAVSGEGALGQEYTSIVDENVEPFMTLLNLRGKPAHLFQRTEISKHEFDLRIFGRTLNLLHHLSSARCVASMDKNMMSLYR